MKRTKKSAKAGKTPEFLQEKRIGHGGRKRGRKR